MLSAFLLTFSSALHKRMSNKNNPQIITYIMQCYGHHLFMFTFLARQRMTYFDGTRLFTPQPVECSRSGAARLKEMSFELNIVLECSLGICSVRLLIRGVI